ncbi:MAG: 50S ribosomal protein L11 methyltransferase [Gammaproteobacteria bacterium]|nr:50S ribosomal protein L11 methyltransferase [Gammaproteobacteria bacterium]MDH5728357.1 50S ribosomal protein L11 methyltransferase [Gammaproteobacteria bacterium]
MSWLQLTIHSNSQLAPLWQNLLESWGAVSLTLVDGGDEPVFEPKPGQETLWSDTRIIALFESEQNSQTELQQLLVSDIAINISGQTPKFQIEKLEDQDWERAWLDQFKPMHFGHHLWIVPTAYEPPEPDGINIILDPGLAFGTGTHPTTAMVLQWMSGHDFTDKAVIDYGCGSGILAVAAAKLGANKTLAVDIDPQAVTATKENAKNNKVTGKIRTGLVDEFELPVVDVLLANILAQPLMLLADNFSHLLKPGAIIVLSGILREQVADVTQAYTPFFDVSPALYTEDWALLTATKKTK